MLKEINGLHHITSMSADANENNAFFTQTLGLRRVKKTVNFDRPDVYHLYYGDEHGRPGSVMTYFPFPQMPKGRRGNGEVGTTAFAVPEGAIDFWKKRLETFDIQGLSQYTRFGEMRILFEGPDGDNFSIVETKNDTRAPWMSDGISDDVAIRGFHSAEMKLADDGAMAELLTFMNHSFVEREGNISRYMVENGNGADIIDIETTPSGNAVDQGAGSVHHIAFSVDNRETQLTVRKALMDTGYAVTPVIDRDYFFAIYFRTPGGILFEIATNEPGFDRDEDTANLGKALKLPSQHEHLRSQLEETLEPIKG